ncbi:MAG TPA: 6-pyruvoyl-tetrahydropterin synthase-related protein, partial [Anaerolineae bacterium]|nr:6-pyruvoyl-tetrahydropterin synthase-related protein [Anaerolineae bacterium]
MMSPINLKNFIFKHPYLLSLIILSLIILSPLGHAPPHGHDSLIHYYRIPYLHDLWQQGTFFTRWNPDLFLGYGYPLFNFYPPLSAYSLTFIYQLTGQNGPLALNLTSALTLALGPLGMFLLIKTWHGPRRALLASTAYLFAPYYIYQTFQRGSLSNAWAMALFPWAIWALYQLYHHRQNRWLWLSTITIAAIFLSHIVASFIFFPALITITLAILTLPPPSSSPHNHHIRKLTTFPLLAGALLACFMWLPALIEIDLTRYTTSASETTSVNAQHFISLWQLPSTPIATSYNADLPITPGLPQILLGLLALLAAWLALWRNPKPSIPLLTLTSGLLALGSLFFATPASIWFWENLAPLRIIQFPWRTLDVSTFFWTVTLAGIPLPATSKKSPFYHHLLLPTLITLFFLPAIPYLYPPLITDLPTSPSKQDASRLQNEFYVYGLTGWTEYSASQVTTLPTQLPFPQADDNQPLAAKLLNPPPNLTVIDTGRWHAHWQSDFTSPQTVTLATHYFPGWQLTINNTPIPKPYDNRGRLHFTIPPGPQTIHLHFGSTPIRQLANFLSLLALLTLGLLTLYLFRSPHPTSITPPHTPTTTFSPLLPLFALFLLTSKLFFFDNINTPFIYHPTPDYIPTTQQHPNITLDAPIQLLGHSLDDHKLTLYWQTTAPVTDRYAIRITLTDPLGRPIFKTTNPNPGQSAPHNWLPHILIRDPYHIPLPDKPIPAAYRLYVELINDTTAQPVKYTSTSLAQTNLTKIFLGRLKHPPPSPPPLPQPTIGTRFDEAILLRSFTTALTPTPTITLTWQSLHTVNQNHTIFLHLLDEDGDLVQALDAQPWGGRYPTAAWSPGEILHTPHPLPPDLPPGQYQLVTGL